MGNHSLDKEPERILVSAIRHIREGLRGRRYGIVIAGSIRHYLGDLLSTCGSAGPEVSAVCCVAWLTQATTGITAKYVARSEPLDENPE
jgi:hypothetical protein